MGVELRIEHRVAYVRIDRPEVLNALDSAAAARLTEIWAELERRTDVSVAVLTGAGDRSFCSGADLTENHEGSSTEYWARQGIAGFGGLGGAADLSVPVIARVNGYALGGGLEMVLGADLAVAADDIHLGFVEPRVGRVPLGGGLVSARRLAYKHAMEILLTGRRFSAARAVELGLINRAVSRDQLDDAVDEYVQDILRCAPGALRAIKATYLKTAHLRADEAMQAKVPDLIAVLGGPEEAEGVAAFREKRPPAWIPVTEGGNDG